ncbi:MAG TPA: hypothetical protein VH720_04415 [Candidatus Limnocylindrales bacterium]|jgi:hypothetical protein
MHPTALTFLAIELADQRAREAADHRLAREFTDGRASTVRRVAARIAAGLGIALARVAIRIDRGAADPIRRRLVADRLDQLERDGSAAA